MVRPDFRNFITTDHKYIRKEGKRYIYELGEKAKKNLNKAKEAWVDFASKDEENYMNYAKAQLTYSKMLNGRIKNVKEKSLKLWNKYF